MSAYSTEDCLIDFTTCPKGTRLVDYFNELTAIPNIKDFTNDDEIRIAICLTDFDSPFVKRFTDSELKLNAIFDFLELDKKKNRQLFNEVISWKNERITQFVSAYLQMQAEHDWTRYINLQRLNAELQGELSRPIKFENAEEKDITAAVNRKLAIEKQMDDLGEKLRKYETVLFPDRAMKRAVVIEEMKKIVTYAEKYGQENTYI